MINKTTRFASAGTTAGSSSAGYTTGMIPQTVAKAEDVNLYMGMSDQQLLVVCQELVNLLAANGISPDSNNNSQLAQMFDQKIKNTFALTGIDKASYTSAPTQTGNSISFPAMKIMFNTEVYYGQTDSTHQVTTLSAQTLAATNAWTNGVHFIYAKTTSGATTCTLDHQTSPISASEGATKCMLGSVFVINGAFQSGSWKFQPWLQITSPEKRESPTAQTKGGFVSPASATTLQMGALEIMDEGINFAADQFAPSITTVPAVSPYPYKFLYPDYNPSASEVTTLDTTHIYNMTDGTWDDISSMASDVNPHYIVMVPCVTPTGQTLLIPAMSPKSGGSYTQIFDSMDSAVNSVYSLQYSLLNSNGNSVTARAIYLGQSLIVKVGATNLQDPTQFITVGMVPQALASFTSASGQSGGSVATYRPMPSIVWSSSYSTITCQNNSANVVIDSGSGTKTITMPTPVSNIINQLEIHFTCTGGSLSFSDNIFWWLDVAPVFEIGSTYNLVMEYINGQWFGGVLAVEV